MTRTIRAAAVAALAASSLAACGGGDPGATSGAEPGSAGSAPAALKEYDGPSAKYFTAIPDAEIKPGTRFVLGYSNPYAAIPGLLAEQKAACAEAVRLGGSCIAKDANVSVQNQVSQMNELLSQNVTAIAISALDPQALGPSFTAAKEANVPVVATELPADPSQPLNPLVRSTVNQALDYSAWATMTAVAKAMPGGEFAVMGTASPNPLLQYLLEREKYWATAQGMKFLGRVDAQQDNPSAWAAAAGALAQKYRTMKVLITYNDPAAVAASNAVRAGGRTDVKVADANGYSATARAAIRSGKMVASYAVPWEEKGRGMATVAYLAQTGQPVPEIVAIKGEVVTADNADSVKTTG